MGFNEHVGSLKADNGRSLSVWMNHETPYSSDHFQNQFHCRGILPYFAFLEDLQANGILGRFFCTLQGQGVCGTPFLYAAS